MCVWSTGWGKYFCVQWCESTLQWREILLCSLMCLLGKMWGNCYCVQWCLYELQCYGSFTVLSDVCMRYRVGEMLLFKLCESEVQGEWDVTVYSNVFEVECEWNITVYSDMCLRYRVREILLCGIMCFWGTVWGKCYCVIWCVQEVQRDGNFTVYSDVCLGYRMRELLLCTVNWL